MGIILCTLCKNSSISNSTLIVQVGSSKMLETTILTNNFPVLFMLDEIPSLNSRTPIDIHVTVRSKHSQLDLFKAQDQIDILADSNICHTIVFKVAPLGIT